MDKNFLALDVGGTKTNVALFTRGGDGELIFLKEQKYLTQQFSGLPEIILDFIRDEQQIFGISIAVAGPVVNDEVQLTNVKWAISKADIIEKIAVQDVYIINDLESSAFAIPYLEEGDLVTIYDSQSALKGNAAVIAPGTGLGEAAMYWDGKEYHPFATEGGHCDFGPRDETDIDLLVYLQNKFGHVSWERLVSGLGIINIFNFLLSTGDYKMDPNFERKIFEGDEAANISLAASEGIPIAQKTMHLFIKYLAVESTNMALKFKAMGGLYIGGGIIPKIWTSEYEDLFMQHFFYVGRMEPLLRRIPVTIVLNQKSALLGAAYFMCRQTEYKVLEMS